jgi:DTW domain-containing protein YfiP
MLKMLAPSQVTIVREPEIEVTFLQSPEEHEKTVVLLPSSTARALDALPLEELLSIKRLVVVDGPWGKVEALAKRYVPELRRVVLRGSSIETNFWRINKRTSAHLSTIEATYWFLREWAQLTGAASARLEDVLFYFAAQYQIVHSAMRQHLHTTQGR